MEKILLACGAGASSGFIAQKMRKAAKKRKLDVSIKAVSDTEIMDSIDDVKILMLGPHLAHKLEDVQTMVLDNGTQVVLIDKMYYATLDGDGVLDVALKYL